MKHPGKGLTFQGVIIPATHPTETTSIFVMIAFEKRSHPDAFFHYYMVHMISLACCWCFPPAPPSPSPSPFPNSCDKPSPFDLAALALALQARRRSRFAWAYDMSFIHRITAVKRYANPSTGEPSVTQVMQTAAHKHTVRFSPCRISTGAWTRHAGGGEGGQGAGKIVQGQVEAFHHSCYLRDT